MLTRPSRYRPTLFRALGALAIGLLFAAPGFPLDPATPVTKYTIDFWQDEDGLPSNFVKVVLQASDGYLWLGTKGGLARFDGVRFTSYDDRPGQLGDAEVWAIDEDADGSLLIGTFGGGLSRLKDGRFTTVTVKDGLASDFVTALGRCGDGTLWIGSDDRGITRLQDGRYTAFGTPEGLLDNRVRSLYCDRDNVLWIGTAGGLSSFQKGAFTRYDLGLTRESRVSQIVPDTDGSLWLATWKGGLLHFRNGAVRRYTTEDGLASDFVLSARFDSRGTLWIGTLGGLCRREDERFACYPPRRGLGPSHTEALARIASVAEDNEGNLWAGTESNGLARVKDAAFFTYSEEEGLLFPQSVIEARDGTIWVGSLSSGVTHLHPDGTTKAYGTKEGLLDLTVPSLHEDGDGALWIGTARGLHRLSQGRVTRVTEGGLATASVQAVTRDVNGALWVGTNDIGLVRIHEGVTTVYTAADGILGTQIRNVRAARNGDVWFGTKNGGLHQWTDGRIRAFTTRDGLVSDAVQAVYIAKDDAVWALTRRGVSRLKDGRIASFTVDNGLPTNFIYQLMEDDSGDLWLACRRGVFRIARAAVDALVAGRLEPVVPIAYGAEMGLRGAAPSVGSQPSIFKGRDGRLWFASGQGVSVVDPKTKMTLTTSLPVRIEEIQVGGDSLPAGGTLDIAPGSGNIEIHYTAFSYFAPAAIRFRYRLEGFDPEWVEAGRRRVAYYTSLPPGSYRFRVAASTDDGVSGEATPLAFRQRPHFHETPWFYALGALVGLVLAGGLHRFRIARLEAAEIDLKRRVEEEMAKVHTLSGLLPICAWCHKVREDGGYWQQLDAYISAHSQTQFSHGICPECTTKFRESATTVSPAEGEGGASS